MKNFKKLVVLGAVGAMLATGLAACGGSGSSSSSAAASSAASAASSAAASSSEAAAPAADGDLSGHKIGAPKGVGALYVRAGLRLPPLIYGGGQERGLRAGTENFAFIGGLGLAAKKKLENREEKNEKIARVREALLTTLEREGVDFRVNGGGDTAAHILNLRFPGVKSEVLLHFLEGKGIYVSQGSACHNNGKQTSETLTAMGLAAAERDASLRFSFGDETAAEEMETVAKAVAEGAAMIRMMRGKK